MKVEEKQKAILLRKQGHSLKEIAQELNISKSTASVWLCNIKLDEKAKNRLLSHIKERAIVSTQRKTDNIEKERSKFFKQGLIKTKKLSNISCDQAKIFLAILYWCEGTKTADNILKFANSDPVLIKFFMCVFYKGFNINPKKVKALIHLHDYHNETHQISFWSKITKIPPSQFYRSYRKPNTGKRIRLNYPGCITINYYDKLVSREVFGLIKAISILYK